MDQLMFASLPHTHYRYEVGMLKVPADAGLSDDSRDGCHWAKLSPENAPDSVWV